MKISKLAAGLITAFAVQAASAGVVTIVIDDFNYTQTPAPVSASGWVTNGGGTWTWDSINPVGSAGLVQSYTDGSKFVVNTPDGVTFQGSLAYTTVVNYAGLGGTNGQLTFSAVTSDQAGNTINGSPIPAISSPAPAVDFSAAYASGGAIALAFNGSPVKAWDVSIDSIGVSFECATVKGGTYGSMDEFLSSLRQNEVSGCVPVPGSLSLMGLGGIAAALVARRRKSA